MYSVYILYIQKCSKVFATKTSVVLNINEELLHPCLQNIRNGQSPSDCDSGVPRVPCARKKNIFAPPPKITAKFELKNRCKSKTLLFLTFDIFRIITCVYRYKTSVNKALSLGGSNKAVVWILLVATSLDCERLLKTVLK